MWFNHFREANEVAEPVTDLQFELLGADSVCSIGGGFQGSLQMPNLWFKKCKKTDVIVFLIFPMNLNSVDVIHDNIYIYYTHLL